MVLQRIKPKTVHVYSLLVVLLSEDANFRYKFNLQKKIYTHASPYELA